MTGRRFTEHKNVIDLVYCRRVINVMHEFKCGAAAAMQWLAELDRHDAAQARVPDRFVRNGMIWVDEESYWSDDYGTDFPTR